MINSELRKKMADSWFSYLQMQICKSFEQLEKNKFQFTKRDWHKKKISECGGTSYLLTGGKIFDKVGVNKSTVSGVFPKKFKSKSSEIELGIDHKEYSHSTKLSRENLASLSDDFS